MISIHYAQQMQLQQLQQVVGAFRQRNALNNIQGWARTEIFRHTGVRECFGRISAEKEKTRQNANLRPSRRFWNFSCYACVFILNINKDFIAYKPFYLRSAVVLAFSEE